MDIFLEALLIFGLRVFGISISTIATLMTVRGRKLPAVAAGFVGVLVYVIAIGKVVSNLSNVWNILAYSVGYAVGTLVGMAWEQRMALGFVEVRFISTEKGAEMAEALRQAGFGVTELYGRGRESVVGIVEVIVPRKSVDAVLRVSRGVDAAAMTTVTEARKVHHGYWRLERR